MPQLINGDCLDALKTLPENSIDSCITDPPYHLQSIVKRFGNSNSPAQYGKDGSFSRLSRGFMGKEWDGGDIAFKPEIWTLVYRVLKPGAYLLAFSGARTYHRMACAIEDAGFEIRDQIMWLYGSGFPKSTKLKGKYDGWSNALKPAHEPMVMARKPLIGTLIENMDEYGTGALNIDKTRIGEQIDTIGSTNTAIGRWPANVIHDGSDEVMEEFLKYEEHSSGDKKEGVIGDIRKNVYSPCKGFKANPRPPDTGSIARFFYCAKASNKDRDEGLENFQKQRTGGMQATADGSMKTGSGNDRITERANIHPTVKPTDLMRYLCRLVTPLNGVVLDPFMGSDSTGKGALLEGFDFIGIEREKEYHDIAIARIKFIEEQNRNKLEGV